MALLPLCGVMTAITSSAVPAGPLGSVARAYATAPQALVYGESYGPGGCSGAIPYSSFIPPVGTPSNPCGEVESLQSQGWDVTTADASTWDSMTESQFASYQLLVIPDPDCGFSDSVLADAVADESTWAPAVDGSVLIIGTDPIYHEAGEPSDGQTSPDPAKLVYQGLSYAGGQTGRTGLYLDLSCYYDNFTTTPQGSAILDGLESGFSVYSANNCSSDIHVVASAQQLIGVTNADLSNWGCSTHEYFGTWPSDFVPYALYTDVEGGTPGYTEPCPDLYTPSDGSTAGCPYVLARGGGVSAAAVGLAGPSGTGSVGSNQTLTASVESGGSPVSGASVDLDCVSGPNTGATANIVTGPDGSGTYTYSSSVSGTDEWTATYTPSGGSAQTSTEAAVVWTKISSSASTVVNDVGTGDPWSGSESTGAAAFASSAVNGIDEFTPTGTVTYDLFTNGTCSGEPASSAQVDLSGGDVPDSSDTGALGAGSYSFQASYSGDDNYTESTSDCDPFDVSPASSDLTNVVYDQGTGDPWSGSESTSASAHDSSSVDNVSGFTATGTVTYKLFSTGSCSGTPTSTNAVDLSDGSVPNSPETASLAAGSYSFLASYSGDSNYAASSSCEPFSVSTESSTTSNSVYDASTNDPWSGSEATGASAYATSAVGGTDGFTPTGTVTYDLFSNGSCSGSPTSTEQVDLSDGSVPDSSDTGALAAGSYSFLASYSGDTNYASSSGACEPFVVGLALPTVSNAVSDAGTSEPWGGSEVTGASAFDSSTVGGADPFTPHGTVTYNLFDNGSCSGSPAATEQVHLSSGEVPDSSDTDPLAAGSYSYDASYSGDSNFGALTSDCAPFSVGIASTSNDIASLNSPSVSGQGTTFTATVTIENPGSDSAGDPTGTVEFQSSNDGGLSWTNISGCGSQPLEWSDISGSGTAECLQTYVVGGSGLEVRAIYGGDGNFGGASSSVATQTVDQASTVTVIGLSPLPTVSGQTVTAQATVSVASPGSDSPDAPNETVLFQESTDGTTWTTVTGCSAVTLTWNSATHLGSASCSEALDASDAGLQVRAVSSGDENFSTSVSAPATQVVDLASTDVVPELVPANPVTGQTVTFNASLGISAPGTDLPSAPTGSIAFEISTNGFATYTYLPDCDAQTISWNPATHRGMASCSAIFSASDSGTSLRVQYSGDANFTTSRSGAQRMTIGKAETTTDVTSSPNPAAPGQLATIRATVSTDEPGKGTPSGTVDFVDGGVTLCSHVAVSQTGTASCTARIPVLSDQHLEVVYSGSPDSVGSSTGLSQQVKHGYWLLGADGGVFSFGDAQFHGSLPQSGYTPYGSGGAHSLNAPLVGIASTSDGNGYWLVASDGGVFCYGDAAFYGSTGSKKLNKPVVALVPTFDSKGYWLVASDGGVFAFGDAAFYGSTARLKLNAPVVGMVRTFDGRGYWLVGADGGVFAFGDASFQGSLAGHPLASPVIGVAPTGDGRGYWLVTAKAVVYPIGDAVSYGSNPPSMFPIVAVSGSADGKGYWLVASNGGVFCYGDAQFDGSTAHMTLQRPIVNMSDV